MKNKILILVALLVVTTSLAHADPTDNDLITAIDDGATLSVSTEINIPSYNKVLYQNGSRFASFSQVSNGQPFCAMFAKNASGHDYNRDIAVNIGRQLVQTRHQSVEQTNSAGLVYALNDGGKLFLLCYSGMFNGISNGAPTIGQFKQAMQGIVTLKLHAPLAL